MEELVKMISEKAGITPEQSKAALSTVTGFLKDKMPAGVGSHVESFLNSGGAAGSLGGIADGLKDKLGGFFGK
jgi:hypothetical protein